MRLLFTLLLLLFLVYALFQLSDHPQCGLAYPKVYIASMHCSNAVCTAAIVNRGNLTAGCKQIEVFVDDSPKGVLSSFPDENGQHCESISPGRYVLIKMPDFCSKADRITLKTHFNNVAGDSMLSAVYTSNFICR